MRRLSLRIWALRMLARSDLSHETSRDVIIVLKMSDMSAPCLALPLLYVILGFQSNCRCCRYTHLSLQMSHIIESPFPSLFQ